MNEGNGIKNPFLFFIFFRPLKQKWYFIPRKKELEFYEKLLDFQKKERDEIKKDQVFF